MTFLFVPDLALSIDCKKGFFVVFLKLPFTIYLDYVKFLYFRSEMIITKDR